jgi:uracil-DNA glycosylase family 4
VGFLASGAETKADKPSTELAHRLGCRICPLAKLDNANPDIPAMGSERPLIYILGEAPGAAEDAHRAQFIGESGKLLRAHIPKAWLPDIRWNNVVRTRPLDNVDPDELSIECCRPSVENDIARTKPKAIFAMGRIPLQWAAKVLGIARWRGRRLPVEIAGHRCWLYPFTHPAFLYRKKQKWMEPGFIASDEERIFVHDLERAFAEIESLPSPIIHTREDVALDCEFINGKAGDISRLEALLKWASLQHRVGVDYETNRLRPYAKGSKILTIGVGHSEQSFAFALDHPEAKWSKAERKRVETLWLEFLRGETRKAVHFLGFELEWTAYFWGWELIWDCLWDATESQAAVLDERTDKKSEGPMSLNFLCRQYFGLDLKGLSSLNLNNLENEPLADILTYNCWDAKYHYLIFQAQAKRVKAAKAGYLYATMRDRIKSCVLTQLKGLPIDEEESWRLKAKYQHQVKEALLDLQDEPEWHKFRVRYGKEFKPLSDPHCIMMFRDLLKYKEGEQEVRKGEKERYSVDEDTLKAIGTPFAQAMLRLRKANKKLSTYIYLNDEDKKKIIIWPDKLLHPIFNTVFVRTKRLSAEDPNVQNIPKRDDEGKEVRLQIAAREGQVFVAPDYGQIQARGIAMSSRDKAFCRSLWERDDVHGRWAERIAVVYPAKIGCVGARDALAALKVAKADKKSSEAKALKNFRSAVKNEWTFPLFFGATLRRVSIELEIPEDKLRAEFNAFQREFSGVFDWQERLFNAYNRDGYVDDLFGFRHHGPLTRNEVINSPIQSLETVFVMGGMNRLSKLAHQRRDWNLQPNIQIHDDLTFLMDADKVHKYIPTIIDEMLKIPWDFCNVPITIEVSIGPNLMMMKEKIVASSDQKEWEYK